MKERALAPLPPMPTTITVMNGPNRGAAFRVVSSRVRLGRGADNDIVIENDSKCSRHHAELVLTPQGLEIRDVSDHNVILVDGQECKSALLKDNSIFTLGETKFRLTVQSDALPAAGLPRARSAARRPKAKSSPIRWILIGILLLIVWMGLTDKAQKGPAVPTPDQQLEAELKAADQVRQSAENRRPREAPLNDVGYNQAQEAFVAGFRDYRKGQFERALSSFQACLSLFPTHVLCNRYLSLTQRRFDELIQYHMVLGRKYRDQNQFAACGAAFRNVMVMVKDPANKRYQEAKANFEACQAQTEDRF